MVGKAWRRGHYQKKGTPEMAAEGGTCILVMPSSKGLTKHKEPLEMQNRKKQ
jgi:hypothetical protein